MLDLYARHVLYNLLAAPLAIATFGLVPEPWRRRLMIAALGVAAVVYLGGGLGAWEYPLAAALGALAVLGRGSYAALGAGWLVHTASDAIHHAAGHPMVDSLPLSSFGCAVFDPLLAIWLFAGAPDTRAMLDAAGRGVVRPRGAP
ncbi:MAG TPA: DUF6010 family protein [Polyangiaceae bacterium]|nr:DUF6010 family protein [Polyangiaceae bacterium]